MTSHHDVAGLLLRLRSRVHDAPMDHEHMMDEAIEVLESQAKALSEAQESQQRQFDKYQTALKSGATSPPTAEGIAAAIRKTEYKYFGDYEFSESQWDAVHCLVNAARHYLAAEARLAEARKVIERDMEALTEADAQIEYLHDKFKPTGSGANAIARIDITLTAARAFTNAAKEKT